MATTIARCDSPCIGRKGKNMSAQLDIYAEIHQRTRMEPLLAENVWLRHELEQQGIDPDMLLAAVAQMRRRKKNKRYAR